MKTLLTSLFLAIGFISFSQISAELKFDNQSDKINDVNVEIVNIKGRGPFMYKWSNKETSLDSIISRKNTENEDVSVRITNASGDTLNLVGSVEANVMTEKMNSFMRPVVEAIASVLFFDPFEFVGIYDPVIYNNEGVALTHPNGDKKTQSIPFIVIWLVVGAIIFTIRMKFVNIRGVKHSIDIVKGKYEDPNDKGEVSPFQALTTALSATVGLGNIAGVAIAIVAGGPGATFWIIVAGLLGMSTKFVECTLGVKFRKIDENGEVSGGPMYYLSKGLAEQGKGKLGTVLGAAFAILCIGGSFGGGNMFQANQAFAQFAVKFPEYSEYGFVFGLIMAALVAVVIIGGIKSIAKVTDKIVPFMCGLYVLFALIIIGMNFTNIGDVFSMIYNGAFNAEAVKGGVIGVLIIGFQRAAFSNEAGVGSASIAHSAVKTKEPVSEGFVALLEPFIDTVVVCTMTALVLIFTGFADGGAAGHTGAELTSDAFSSVFPWFSWVLMIAILLFAFSTMVSWSYYGQKAWGYLFGESKTAEYIYKSIFVVFVVIGSSIGLGAVLDFSDLMVLGMAFPNVLGLYFLAPIVRKEMQSFVARVKSGEIKAFK